MKTNPVRETLLSGGVSVGSFLGLQSPNVAELLGHAGFQWLMIETEHNALDMSGVEQMIRAIETTPAVPMVRAPANDPVFIQRAIDVGAMGVMVPLVRTVEDVERLVSITRFPPEGTRGFGGLRASQYTFDNEGCFRQSNDRIVVVPIIETKEALENIDQIAAVPGVDVLMMGPFDLYLSLGLDPFQQPLPEGEEAFERVLAAGRKHNVAVGAAYGSADQLMARREQGFRMLAVTDYMLLARMAQADLSKLGVHPNHRD